jgi:hypothetical protein
VDRGARAVYGPPLTHSFIHSFRGIMYEPAFATRNILNRGNNSAFVTRSGMEGRPSVIRVEPGHLDRKYGDHGLGSAETAVQLL